MADKNKPFFNKFKVPFAIIIAFLAILVFSHISFIGEYYLTIGNFEESLKTSIIVFIFLFIPALAAWHCKRAKINHTIHYFFEGVSIITFLGVVWCNLPIFSQPFFVYENKDEISSKIKANIENIESMYAEYDTYTQNRKNQYASFLQSVVKAKRVNKSLYQDMGFGKGYDDKELGDKLYNLSNKLLPQELIQGRKCNLKWCEQAKNSASNWAWTQIIDNLKMTKSNGEEWYSKLINRSKYRERSEQTKNFEYSLKYTDVDEYFLTEGDLNPLVIIIGLGLVLLMLLPWMIEIRDPARKIAPYEIVL